MKAVGEVKVGFTMTRMVAELFSAGVLTQHLKKYVDSSWGWVLLRFLRDVYEEALLAKSGGAPGYFSSGRTF